MLWRHVVLWVRVAAGPSGKGYELSCRNLALCCLCKVELAAPAGILAAAPKVLYWEEAPSAAPLDVLAVASCTETEAASLGLCAPC